MDYILKRLSEPSTYAGLSGLATVLHVSQPLYGAATAFVAAGAALLSVIIAERKR
jgi:hypothetical protein